MSHTTTSSYPDANSPGVLRRAVNAPKAAPVSDVVLKEEDVPVVSPVKPLSYEEADAKIRAGADLFSFNAGGDRVGRVDVVNLGTKSPSEDNWDVSVIKGTDGEKTLYAGVYDGHNGEETSKLLSKSLAPYVASALAGLPDGSDSATAEDAIKQAFVRLDDRIFRDAATALAAGHPAGAAELRAATAPAFAGSCALLLIYEPGSATLRIASAGDSRAVRGRWSPDREKPEVEALSKDHNVENKEEFARIAAAHPGEEKDIMHTDYGLLYMAVTRAFGNHKWKWPVELINQARSSCHAPKPWKEYKTPPYMTASPDVTTCAVCAQDFVILGSDGLWEAISNEDAVECVSRWLEARRSGKPEPVVESRESRYDVLDGGQLCRTVRPTDFAIEDLDNAAVCLLKNVLGGRHRYMVAGALTATPPICRYVRDDISVQVIFFQTP